METSNSKITYNVSDIIQMHAYLDKQHKTTTSVAVRNLAELQLKGLEEVMFRIVLNICDQNGVYIDGMVSVLGHNAPNMKALDIAITDTIEVTEAEDVSIQTAAAAGEIIAKAANENNPTVTTLLDLTTFNALKKKLQKGRVKDTMEVVDTYRYNYNDRLKSGEITMNDLLNLIEQETNCHPFSAMRNTVAKIAITRNSNVKQHNKFPGFRDAMELVQKSIPGFDMDAARIFTQESVRVYAPVVQHQIETVREERNKKRENYVEKGYKK